MTRLFQSVLTASLCLLGSSLFDQLAAEQIAQPACEPNEKFYPDGRIVALGERYFLLCNGSHFSSKKEGWSSLKIANARGESAAERAISDKHQGLRYTGSLSYQPEMGKHPYDWERKVATKYAGPVEYSVYVAVYDEEKARDIVAQGGLPPHAIYHAEATADLPEHFLSCITSLDEPHADRFWCRLYVTYAPGEHFYISQIYLTFSEYGLIGFGAAEFSLANLADHVRGLHLAYQALEIEGAGE